MPIANAKSGHSWSQAGDAVEDHEFGRDVRTVVRAGNIVHEWGPDVGSGLKNSVTEESEYDSVGYSVGWERDVRQFLGFAGECR